MKKGKLLLTTMLITTLFSATIVSAEGLENYSKSDESTQASGEPTVEWVIPHSVKIGEEITTIAVGKNLPVTVDGEQAKVTVTSPLFKDAMLFGNNGYRAHAYGTPEVDADGTGIVTIGHDSRITAFRPCSIVLNFSVANLSGDVITVGEPYTVTVEEPIIQDNAPDTVKSGESINLQTELTNTALVNTDVAYYYDPENYNDGFLVADSTHKHHVAAYQPMVEVIEGAELVEQTEQDYSHTLNSSEKLTFTGEGTVKLRIVYNQIVNCSCLYMDMSDELYNPELYSPEKIVTINVGSSGTENVYEQQLKDKVTEIENAALSKDDYTAESWNAYVNAVNYAKSILNKQDATEEEYKNALTMLEDAEKGMVKAGGSETGSKDDTTKPDGSDSKDTAAKDSAVPKTGDTVNIVSALIIMVGALLILGIAGVKRKVK